MTEIPADEKAARDAWNALPETVRRAALSQASQGRAAVDPSVAAIIAGVVRVREPHRSWPRRVAAAFPFAAAVGVLIALQYFGLLSMDRVMAGAGLVVGGVAVLLVGLSSAARLLRKLRGRATTEDLSTSAIPKYAEFPNLRVAIDAAPSTVAEPLVVRGHPHLRDFLTATALAGVLALGFIAVLDAIRPVGGDFHRLLYTHFAFGIWAGLIGSWVSWARHLRHLPMRMTEDGLRFGLRQPIPWRDVLGVEYAGPTAAFPDARAGLVWRLRDRPGVRIDLDAVATPPERIVRTAEAYLGRRSLLT